MRFGRIVSLLPPCGLLAEVGCDHALLTALALETGRCREAIVSDIRPQCLKKAKKTLAGYDCVTYLVGDGIVTDGRTPDCIMICGMGGHTIRGILERYRGDSDLLLSPQSHAEQVRIALLASGYALVRDECFEADGKFYDVMFARKGAMELNGLQIGYGRFYTEKNDALRRRLERLLGHLYGDAEANAGRIAELTEVLKWQR